MENTSQSRRMVLVSFIQDWTRRKGVDPDIKQIALRIYLLDKEVKREPFLKEEDAEMSSMVGFGRIGFTRGPIPTRRPCNGASDFAWSRQESICSSFIRSTN